MRVVPEPTNYRRRRVPMAAVAGLAACAALATSRAATPPGTVPLTIAETLGQRRFGHPVTAHVPLPQGELTDASHSVLQADARPMRGVQYDVRSRWPEGSVQWLNLSFNLSPGPLEEQKLVLKYGGEVTHPDPGPGVVQESPEALTIRGAYRIPKRGAGLVDSIRYGANEFLSAPIRLELGRSSPGGSGVEWRSLDPDLAHASLVSPGPVNAVVALSGSYEGAKGPLPYRITLQQPNSTSWLDLAVEVRNPMREAIRASLKAPYAVERKPALFDFGGGSWLYGTIVPGGLARLTVPPGGAWRLETFRTSVPLSDGSSYAERSPLQPRFEGWGQLIDGEQGGRVVAFGSPDFSRPGRDGDQHISVSGDGTVSLEWPPTRDRRIRFRALFHHVGDPVHVTAATSPLAMLRPLQVRLPSGWHSRCRVTSASAPWP